PMRGLCNNMQGALIAAPASHHGKTCVAVGLVRALVTQGYDVFCAKAGPDYIDRDYLHHSARCLQNIWNLDAWAMGDDVVQNLVLRESQGRIIIIEGVMGLFDGAINTPATTAHLAKLTGIPVILVVSARAVGASIAATIKGFAEFDPDCKIAGVIINDIASQRHSALITHALQTHLPAMPIVGLLPRDPQISLPSRHLGLVQASEQDAGFYDSAARWLQDHCDWSGLLQCMGVSERAAIPAIAKDLPIIPPLGQRICVVRDLAFAFVYEHILADWQASGSEITIISALNDEPVPEDCDVLYLPGGYPELYLAHLDGAQKFRQSVHDFAQSHKVIYAECGGFMILGDVIIDTQGRAWPQSGLLGITSDMQHAKRHLGYRQALLQEDFGAWPKGMIMRGHEFHYAACTYSDNSCDAEFLSCQDSTGALHPLITARCGLIGGSFFHMMGSGSF
ncbi:MAG: cobyrinate a,c-diamide synthase, partial [Pseudomonadota bacterium]